MIKQNVLVFLSALLILNNFQAWAQVKIDNKNYKMTSIKDKGQQAPKEYFTGNVFVNEYKMFVNAALNVGVTPVEVKEILYQAVPYVGIAKVIDFIYATNEIFKERNIALPLEPQSTTTPETRKEIGIAKQKEIVGSKVNDMYKNSPKDLLHIQEYLSANCFGDFVTRSGLDVKKREMVTLSLLIALGGTEAQIKGHIQGNANVGNDRQTLINLVTQLIPYVGYPRALNAITCLNEVLPEKKN